MQFPDVQGRGRQWVLLPHSLRKHIISHLALSISPWKFPGVPFAQLKIEGVKVVFFWNRQVIILLCSHRWCQAKFLSTDMTTPPPKPTCDYSYLIYKQCLVPGKYLLPRVSRSTTVLSFSYQLCLQLQSYERTWSISLRIFLFLSLSEVCSFFKLDMCLSRVNYEILVKISYFILPSIFPHYYGNKILIILCESSSTLFLVHVTWRSHIT